jgi:hypothetical protein
MIRFLTTLLCLQVSALLACNVPVFRYALERWDSDPFQLVLVHPGPLPDELGKVVQALEPVMTPGSARPNWSVLKIDANKPVPALWAGLISADKAKPQILLCTPEWQKGEPALWSGPLAVEQLRYLAESPLRSQLRDELLKGTAVVWLLVDGKDKAANDALHALVEKESTRLKDAILIPPNIGKDGVNVLSNLPIEVSFKSYRLTAENQDESLLRLLLGEAAVPEKPLLVPVFGRGRALAVMKQETVNVQLIEETARFLCGACSCQVKASNPGFDLLIQADWLSILGDAAPAMPEPKAGTKPEYVPIPGKKK